MKKFHQINWKQCLEEQQRDQENLTKSYREGKPEQVRAIQNKIVTSFATRALAVRKIVTNRGGETPGIDGVLWATTESKAQAMEEVHHWTQNPKQYKAKPVKRVLIPKPGKAERRPLGIPTMLDRAMQEIYKQSIDPIVEEQSDPNSYGFRKFRGTTEATAKLAGCLNRDFSAAWILDADIERCFDRINHPWLIKNTPILHKNVLISWLESGVQLHRKGDMEPTEQGTPQGGIISPLLCNICLNGLEREILGRASKYKLRFPKVHVIRYADDFVVTGVEERLLWDAAETAREFLSIRGLEMHPEKSRILNIYEEKFTFLGFEYFKKSLDTRRNRPSEKGNTKYRLIYRPSSTNLRRLKGKVREVLRKRSEMVTLIKELNPIVKGWAEYYRISRQSMRTFAKLRKTLWFMMLGWAKRKYSRRSSAKIIEICTGKHLNQVSQWRWRKGKQNLWLYRIDRMKYLFIPKLTERKLNPYLAAEREILEERALKLSTLRKEGLKKILTGRQKDKCLVCGARLGEEQFLEIHHIKPKSQGGSNRLTNLMLIHKACHKIVHTNARQFANLSALRQ